MSIIGNGYIEIMNKRCIWLSIKDIKILGFRNFERKASMFTIVNFSIAAGTMDPEDFIEVSTRQSHLPHTLSIIMN